MNHIDVEFANLTVLTSLSKFGYIGNSFLAQRQPYTVQSVQFHRESEANGLIYEFTCNYRINKETSYNYRHI